MRDQIFTDSHHQGGLACKKIYIGDGMLKVSLSGIEVYKLKQSIPKYLERQGVTVATMLENGLTIEDMDISHWLQVAVSHGISSPKLDVVFRDSDFELVPDGDSRLNDAAASKLMELTATSSQINAFQAAIDQNAASIATLGGVDQSTLAQINALLGADSTIQADIALLQQQVANRVQSDFYNTAEASRTAELQVLTDGVANRVQTTYYNTQEAARDAEIATLNSQMSNRVTSTYYNAQEAVQNALISANVTQIDHNLRIGVVDTALSGKQATLADLSQFTALSCSDIDSVGSKSIITAVERAQIGSSATDVGQLQVTSTDHGSRVTVLEGHRVTDSTQIAASKTLSEQNLTRLDTLIDSGSALDAISELKQNWETAIASGDTTLSNLITSKLAVSVHTAAVVAQASTDSDQDVLIAAKQVQLDAGQLSVVNAEVYSSGEKVKVALYDSAASLTTLLGQKQDNLSVSEQAVIAEQPFTSAEKSKVALYDSAASLTTLLGQKQDNLSVSEQAVIAEQPFTSAEKSKVALYDSANSLTTLLSAKLSTSTAAITYRTQADSYSQSEVDTAVGLKLATSVAASTYRTQADSYSQSEVDTAVGLKLATSVAASTYRTQADSYSQSEVDTAVGLKLATSVAASTYRTQADSYSQAQIDTAVGLKLATSVAASTYRTQADSYTQAQVDSKDSVIQAQVTVNSATVSYTDAALVANHATLHTAHTASLLLKAAKDDPVFTTKLSCPEIHAPRLMSQNAHLVIGSTHTNDLVVKLNDSECLQVTRPNSSEVRLTANGGTGNCVFMQGICVSADAPSSSGVAGLQHQIRVDDDYLYVKTSGNWKRVALTTFS